MNSPTLYEILFKSNLLFNGWLSLLRAPKNFNFIDTTSTSLLLSKKSIYFFICLTIPL